MGETTPCQITAIGHKCLSSSPPDPPPAPSMRSMRSGQGIPSVTRISFNSVTADLAHRPIHISPVGCSRSRSAVRLHGLDHSLWILWCAQNVADYGMYLSAYPAIRGRPNESMAYRQRGLPRHIFRMPQASGTSWRTCGFVKYPGISARSLRST
jgi:hypothetical protein